MKKCLKCENEILNPTILNGRKINTQRRKFCFECSPLGQHNTKNLTESLSPKLQKKHKTTSAQVQKFRDKRKQRIVASMGGCCQCCGYNRYNGVLELHHLDPNKKEFSCGAASANPIKWEKLIIELRKCVMLCSNCHKEVHAKIRVIPDNAKRFDESWVNYKLKEMAVRAGFEPA